MSLEYTVTIGNILSMVVFLFSGVGAWFGLKQLVAILSYRVTSIEANVDDLKEDVKSLAAVLIKLASHEQTLVHLQLEIDDLKRGEGLVLPLYRSAYEVPPKK